MARRTYSEDTISTEGLLLSLELNNMTSGIEDQSPYQRPKVNNMLSGMKLYSTPEGSFVGLTQTTGGHLKFLINASMYPYTRVYWIRRVAISGHGWFFEYRNSANTDWSANAGSGASRYGRNEFSYDRLISSYLNLSNNIWYHVCVTHDGRTCKLYLNGTLEKTDNVTVSQEMYSYFCFRYADDDGDNAANAAFRKFKLYNRTLNESEINTIYTLEKF